MIFSPEEISTRQRAETEKIITVNQILIVGTFALVHVFIVIALFSLIDATGWWWTLLAELLWIFYSGLLVYRFWAVWRRKQLSQIPMQPSLGYTMPVEEHPQPMIQTHEPYQSYEQGYASQGAER